MTLLWAIAIVIVVTSVAVGLMLIVRRGAPDGGYFHDGDRAAGVFGVLATGFSVLLGFIVFLAFTSYDTARAGAETEAGIVTQQVGDRTPVPAGDRTRARRGVGVLRAIRGGRAVGPDGRRDHRRRPQSVGREDVRDHPSRSTRRRRQSRRPMPSGSTSARPAKPRARTASTARSVSSRIRCGSCSSSLRW